MALRIGHGTGKGSPRVEVLPVDELPDGIPAPPREPEPPEPAGTRGPDGRFLPGKGSSDAARKAALAKHAKARQPALAERLTLGGFELLEEYRPYSKAASEFALAEVQRLSDLVGGGQCGSAPSLLIQTASLQRAASAYLFDRGGAEGDPALFTTASRLGDASRQNLLAAHELCAKEATARAKTLSPADIRRQRELALARGRS